MDRSLHISAVCAGLAVWRGAVSGSLAGPMSLWIRQEAARSRGERALAATSCRLKAQSQQGGVILRENKTRHGLLGQAAFLCSGSRRRWAGRHATGSGGTTGGSRREAGREAGVIRFGVYYRGNRKGDGLHIKQAWGPLLGRKVEVGYYIYNVYPLFRGECFVFLKIFLTVRG